MARLEMNLGMQQRAEQRMLLQPRMLQSIEVLQLAGVELEGWLLEQAESNEALVVEGGELAGGPPERPAHVRERRGTRADSEAHDEMLRNQPARPRGLGELIEEQLATADLDAGLTEWVRLLAGCLDPGGTLSASDDVLLDLARERGLAGAEAMLGAAIAALQGLEPRGIGARGAIEALLLQLDPRDPDYTLLCRLLEEFVEDLAKNRLPQVAKALGLELGDLARLLDVLRELDPRPAAGLVDEAVPAIVPEVVVTRVADGFEVSVSRAALPSVRIDPDVQDLARDRSQPRDVRRYLRGKLDQARWVVDAVAQRGETLLRVARAVFAHQRPFLDGGHGHLRPLTMGAVADELGVHVSTVSRAVAGKYAQTPWGIAPLRSFFQSSAGGNDGAARDDVRETVRAVFDGEDRTRPLSDDDVVALLAERGVRVARRTVTKYRKELSIPSSYRRRAYPGS